MKSFCLFTFAILMLFTTEAFSQKTKKNDLTYESYYKQFRNMELDFSSVSKVRDFFMPRETAIFNLDSGLVYFSKPVAGRVIAAIFTGKGHFQYNPPLKVEQTELERFCDAQSIEGTFSKMIIMFTDSTDNDIINAFPPSESEYDLNLVKMLDKFNEFNRSRLLFEIDRDVAKVLLNNKSGFFQAYIDMDEGNPLMFEINPTVKEEISLYRFRGKILGKDLAELVNQYHYTADYQLTDSLLKEHNNYDINIDKYTIDCHIEENLNLVCKTKAEFTALADNAKWLGFDLGYLLKVDSVVSQSGEKLASYKDEKGYDVWVRLPEPLVKGRKYSLDFYYQGKILGRQFDTIYFKNSASSSWYPGYGYKEKSLFDVTYHYPRNCELISVGNMLSADTAKDFITSRWVTDYPVAEASFDLGPFISAKSEDKDIPLIDIKSITKEKRDDVMRHARLSYKYFNNIFGTLPIKKLYITEMPYKYSKAFAGLLQMDTSSYKYYNTDGLSEIDLASMIAHQWWGVGVNFNSYRDLWLSEGFSRYSALLYMQIILKDNNKFMEVLDRYKKDMLEVRSSPFGKGIEGGPLSIGLRNSAKLVTQTDSGLVMNKKGAWALHMLRIMCINVKTMNEDVFNRILKKFYTEFKGRNATTRDFQTIAENEMHLELGWFFDQWVDGAKIPKYKYAFKTEQAETGKYVTKLKIRQENVPEDFKMLLPIQIAFKGARPVREKIFMTGAEIVTELPPYAYIPEDVILNDLNGVLCEVEKVNWEEMN